MSFLLFSFAGVLQVLLVLAKFFGYLPSWSTAVFVDFLFFGFYKVVQAVSFCRGVSFKGVWGAFFIFSSLALLGQEFSLWHFWTVENSLIMVALFFSLALCINTFFLKSAFSKVLVLVPGVFLFMLTLVAFLVFYRYLHQKCLIPLWQVNLLMLFIAVLGGVGQNLFLGRKGLLEFLRSL